MIEMLLFIYCKFEFVAVNDLVLQIQIGAFSLVGFIWPASLSILALPFKFWPTMDARHTQ